MAWFSLDDGGTPTQPSDYSLVSSPSCDGSDQICAVQANDNGSGQPILSNALKDEMINALHNRASSTNVQLKDA